MPAKALLVIDMQNDYLWPERRPKFTYDTEALVSAVNRAIQAHRDRGDDIIYIAQVFDDLPTNRWWIGFSIKGTAGAQLYDGLTRASDLYFEKRLPDAFTARAFREFARERGYTELTLCGLDTCGCIAATAKSAIKRGLKVSIPENCVASRFGESRVTRMKARLNDMGVVTIQSTQVSFGEVSEGLRSSDL